uniref:hypothetical protein n=1 Tax=Roseivirga sp. TaxID=1964215 RepID=UPI004048049A
MNTQVKPFSKITFSFSRIKYLASKIDFVERQDVEGHELDAFKGMTLFDRFENLPSLGYSRFFLYTLVLPTLNQFNLKMHQAITYKGEIIGKKNTSTTSFSK